MRRQRDNSPAGFTLIEVMMAISILALLTVVIAVSWRVAASAQGKVDAEVLRNRGAEAAADLMDKQLASMVAVRDPNVETEKLAFFQGSADAVRFVSRYSLGAKSRAGLVLVEYRVERDERGDRLVSREAPLRASSDLVAPDALTTVTQDRVLPLLPVADEPVQYLFAYLLEDEQTHAKLQAQQWNGRGGVLPLGIVLQAVSRSNERQAGQAAEQWTFRVHTRDVERGAPFNPALPYQ